ncbi:MAG: beta-ketoacyl-ACP synthase 3, partial [Gammaproteobacteria bacterium]|nr:beta-ketoacyl-ACP synthase 3 [Gammaproteobacteria bacterium]
LGDMAHVASARALACAGLEAKDLDLIVFGTTTHDDQCPNMASGLQKMLGAEDCGAMDVNTACTSFLYGLSTAAAMIKTGVVRNALVVGGELISPYMDWNDRNVAVLFGDGAAAVVLQATDRDEGLMLEKLGCYGEAREILRIHGIGGSYVHQGRMLGATEWQFEGQEIFKKAVMGMGLASEDVLQRAGLSPTDIDLVVPHQANLRIIEAVAKRAGVAMDRVYVNVDRYGNMSAATVPVALCEALEDQRIKSGAILLMPAFGGGLTFCAHLVRWGERTTPLATTNIELPPPERSALEMVERYRRSKGAGLT